METNQDILYRYEGYILEEGYLYEDGSYRPPLVEVRLQRFFVIRRTPKGAWIRYYTGKQKFVLLTARKRFACQTIEEARVSFIARKKRQICLLTHTLEAAKAELSKALNIHHQE